MALARMASRSAVCKPLYGLKARGPLPLLLPASAVGGADFQELMRSLLIRLVGRTQDGGSTRPPSRPYCSALGKIAVAKSVILCIGYASQGLPPSLMDRLFVPGRLARRMIAPLRGSWSATDLTFKEPNLNWLSTCFQALMGGQGRCPHRWSGG